MANLLVTNVPERAVYISNMKSACTYHSPSGIPDRLSLLSILYPWISQFPSSSGGSQTN